MKKRIIFTGGGTGGHVYPALAVIGKIRNDDMEILWMGSSQGMEKKILDRTDIPFYSIPCGKLRRYFSFRNLTDLFRIAAGFFRSLYLLGKLKPQLLFSKGGFVSVPPVMAASFLKIPVFTHDSDVCPGLATKINSRFADKILLSSEESRKFFPARYQNRISVTGNPVRDDLSKGNPETGRAITGFSGERPVLLVMGGSLGAEQINNLVYNDLDKLAEKYDIIHQTGEKNYREITKPGYFGVPYFNDELAHIFTISDLVISRSGASAVWEFAAAGLPSVLIPLEEGSRGEQVRNAEVFAARGCSEILKGDISPETFLDTIENIMDNKEKIEKMKQAARETGSLNGAVLIADLIKGVFK